MTVGGWGRTLRAGVFAAACVLLAALGHVMMSGTSVPWWTMGAGAAATGTAGWLLAGRERGRGLIVAVVVAAQTVLHETFSLGQSLMPASSGTTSADMGGMHMSSSDSMSMDAMDMSGMTHMAHGSADMGHAHTMTGSASLGMLAAHLLAAVLCGLWLAYGERAVFRVLRAAAARLVAPLWMLLALPAPDRHPSTRRRRTPSTGRLSPVSFSATPSPPGDRPRAPLSSETAGTTRAHPLLVMPRSGAVLPSAARHFVRADERAPSPGPRRTHRVRPHPMCRRAVPHRGTSAPDDPRRTPRDHFCAARSPPGGACRGGRLRHRLGTGRPQRRPPRDRALRPCTARRRTALRRPSQRRPQTAHDLTQDTFVRALDSLPGFEGRASARTWLLSIARRAVADSFRRAAVRPRLADAHDWQLALERAQPRDLPGFDEGIALLDLLETLPDERREAFVLTQVVGLPYEEAARFIGCPVGTIRSRVARARTTLERLLREAETDAVPAA